MVGNKIRAPVEGEKIQIQEDGTRVVPRNPIIPFIEGDGIGPDIWAASQRVIDAAVLKAYSGKKKIIWMEVFAGEKGISVYGQNEWLPQETIDALREYKISIKGPMTTPVGGGIRSINVAIRQKLDLYVCQRPIHYFEGVPSPMKNPENIDMVIFRENTEDIYVGIEFETKSDEAMQIEGLLRKLGKIEKVRFPDTTSYGVKPVSQEGTSRLVKAAIQYAIDQNRKSVTLVHKGNIMKFTEGYFRQWGYETAKKFFNEKTITWEECGGNPPTGKILMKDVIADAFLQQIMLRPSDYDVIATLNLNGDYLSDALAAQVGGIGIAPGANINYHTGIAVFEATHGTAPKHANLDKVNPSSVILSSEMMLRYMGWNEAADLIVKGIGKSIKAKTVTYDFARLMDGARELKCSEFGTAIIQNMP